MATDSQSYCSQVGDDGLTEADRERARAQAREQVVWTPAALDALARIVDSVPVEQSQRGEETDAA